MPPDVLGLRIGIRGRTFYFEAHYDLNRPDCLRVTRVDFRAKAPKDSPLRKSEAQYTLMNHQTSTCDSVLYLYRSDDFVYQRASVAPKSELSIDRDWQPEDLGDWEAEEPEMPPSSDQYITEEATVTHRSISLHVPIDTAEDWSDFEAMLPVAAIRARVGEELSKGPSLTKLAKDSSIWVRCSVAANPSTPPSVLDELASDLYHEVRSHVGGNPSTSVHTLDRLANDLVPVVRASVKNNPSAQIGAPSDKVKIGLGNSKYGRSEVSQVQVKKPTNRGNGNLNLPVVDSRPKGIEVAQAFKRGLATPRPDRLKPDDNVDQLIDRLIAICGSRTDLLQAEDAKRYVYLLHSLSAFEIPRHLRTWTTRRQSTVRTGKLPIHDLRHVIGHWVMSLFSHSNPLMPHFALNTAEFIQRMMIGCREEGPDGLRSNPLWREHSKNTFTLIASFNENSDEDLTRRLAESYHATQR